MFNNRNITTVIVFDYSLLEKAYNDYIKINNPGLEPKYLIMNTETYRAAKEAVENIFQERSKLLNSKYMTYRGIPIAISDSLLYGEVEFV